MNNKSAIGVFDSGLGGISVLRACVKELPGEDYIYYGDSFNAPYGTRPAEEIKELSEKAFLTLLEHDVKAIVVACNTASSVAGKFLRQKYTDMIIIEIEPALKPAVTKFPEGKIVVMATPTTLREKKFASLMDKYGKNADIIKLSCPGLPEFVERGELNSIELEQYLKNEFLKVGELNPDAVILGCTHYPFVKKMIQKVTGKNAEIFDGSEGTARQLRRRLVSTGLLNNGVTKGKIKWLNSNSSNEIILLSQRLFLMDL